MGGIDTVPQSVHPHFHPGMTGSFSYKQTADIPRRHACHTAQGNQHMSIILAHAFPCDKGFTRRCHHIGFTGSIRKMFIHLCTENFSFIQRTQGTKTTQHILFLYTALKLNLRCSVPGLDLH